MPWADLGAARLAGRKGTRKAIMPGRGAIYGSPLDGQSAAALLPDLANGRTAALAAWSGSPDQGRLRRRAAALGVPFAVFDHGLLRAPPWQGCTLPMLSVTVVDLSGPSSLADMLAPARVLKTRDWETHDLLERAAAARRKLVAGRLGGTWWRAGGLPRGDEVALVVDDGMANAGLLRAMLDAALAENPAEKILLFSLDRGRGLGRRRLLADAAMRGYALVSGPIDVWAAIDRAARVYTPGGEVGFLALLAGREVRCFADSFYAGWGVTKDASPVEERPFRRTVDEIFAGACLVATRCLDPFRKTAASFEDTLALLADWRQAEIANRQVAVCTGMSFWKRRRIGEFLRSAADPPVFRRTARGALAASRARRGGAIAAWAARMPSGLAEAAAAQGVPLIRVEDGFIRSVGLGSDFLPAASLVFDRRGLYCDPRQESDLERLLRETEFPAELLERAVRLIARLVAAGVTKYNLGSSAARIEAPSGRRRILVPGQVEDDLSVRLAGGSIRGNLDLLGRVRAANPDAYILYKPHPDVEAGHRCGAIPDHLARQFADRIVRRVSTAALFGEIDELHTLTSLAGFEALLRRRRVVVYGLPFYAGWGLTTDLAAAGRGRRLALEELVAGALILYPRYLDPVTRLSCPPEIVIERLEQNASWRPGPLVVARRLQGVLSRRWAALAQRSLPPPDRRSEPDARAPPGAS
jgi:capsular polysaccharide export protein